MADTATLSRRSQRTATVRRRATAASVGILLGAFALIGVTTALPIDPAPATATAPSGPALSATSRPRQPAATAPATRRIRTRQS
jgi:hypothetical protein